jgi:cAMP-dependent protein kinase regulator
VQSILSNKDLSCEDIQTAGDARTELRRIRQLMNNFDRTNGNGFVSTSDPDIEKKVGRCAIHADENFNDYVKTNVEKDVRVRNLIYNAIKRNVMLSGLMEEELEEIIDVFEPRIYNAGDVIVRQGDREDYLYVVERGDLSMSMNGHTLPASSKVIGERALIYGSRRESSIAATTDGCKLWRIRRSWYRGVVGQYRQRLHMEKLSYLPLVKFRNRLFRDIFEKNQLHTMAQLLKREYYNRGDTILRQGESGDSLYVIHSGEVDIYVREMSSVAPICTEGKGYIFGENALKEDDVRQATVVASR